MARGETQGLLPSLINRLVATNALIALLYVMLVSFLFSFLKTVDRKSGPGNLWKLIVGTYHHPREEESLEFKAVYDADLIANLESESQENPVDEDQIRDLIEKAFLTSGGKNEAQKVLCR